MLVGALLWPIANEIYGKICTSMVACVGMEPASVNMYASSSLTWMLHSEVLDAQAAIMNFGKLASLAFMFKIKT